MQYKSKTFEAIAEQVRSEYTEPPADPMLKHWFKEHAPKWRNRVGIPRLIAESAMVESVSTLRSINRGIFRNDPEMRDRYDAAVEALSDLANEFSGQNWERFQGVTEEERDDAG